MLSLSILLLCQSTLGQQNPPVWPSSVRVFSPGDTDIAQTVNAAYAQNGGQNPPNNGHWSNARYAFLFKPGRYYVDVPVGYYTQVLGLGQSPDDVVFASERGVYCEEGDYNFEVGALTTFWRSAENFMTEANHLWNGQPGMLWAVSQASPLRRVHVKNTLQLFQALDGPGGYASGGFLANSQVDGRVSSGSQQQWMTRNCNLGSWAGGVWNMVFSGTQGAPAPHCSNQNNIPPYVVQSVTPWVAEKPYITIDVNGRYHLMVPPAKSNTVGIDWSTPSRKIPFEQVYVANDKVDTAASINAQLAKGMHIVFAAGIFRLEAALEVTQADQVLLGLGLATLIAQNGGSVIRVGAVGGVRVAGLLLEAGPKPTDALLQWGVPGVAPGTTSAVAKNASAPSAAKTVITKTTITTTTTFDECGTPTTTTSQETNTEVQYPCSDAPDPRNPGVMSDLFVRVGGTITTDVVKTMVRVSSSNVILDNLWLWRADHGVDGLVYNGDSPCHVGIIVDGDNVTAYGLAVEHTLKDQVQWNGNNGETYFYQCELPYDVNQANFGDLGYVGYRVASNVTSHIAKGAGVYHYFRDNAVTVNTGIVAPTVPGVRFVDPLTICLNGKGTIKNVLNNLGAPTDWASRTSWICP